MTVVPTRRHVLRAESGLASLIPAAPCIGLHALADAQISITDAHTHIVRHLGQRRAQGRGRSRGFGGVGENLDEAVPAVLAVMNRFGVAMAIMAPPRAGPVNNYPRSVPVTTNVDVAATAPGADEPLAPLGDGGVGSNISAASGSTRWSVVTVEQHGAGSAPCSRAEPRRFATFPPVYPRGRFLPRVFYHEFT